MILIITLSEDIHALEVKSAAQQLGYPNIHIVECDRIALKAPLRLRLGQNPDRRPTGYFTTSDGLKIQVAEVGAIWMRRPRADQLCLTTNDPTEVEYINNECRAGITSLLSSRCFKGKWVSHPDSTLRACDKILQLQVAQECGFRIPKTLVSQSKAEVIEFHEACGGQIIAKPLLGVADPFLLTRRLENPRSLADEAYLACPTIYQEFIPGTKHVRLNCFGTTQVAALIDSENLDWRPDLNVPMSLWAIPPSVQDGVQKVLQALGLAMGIIDLKLTPEGEVVWFEVNPQGQFLFLEPLIKAGLSVRFARFLIDCAEESSH
jgi:glutathione synthase/RimK-type ligase-like ATP-grasp enzyme